ncbi:hypothetical protein K7A41_18410 [Sphingobacterium sp. InxBP1]|uniref:hypothetical protein n=1 Tax=Sphingobacterium sp. InxBP1 TaxID=2870328 RepID=UPI002244BB7E|nr:hypothetical protein [Sphingobacterium sp. InxBP1]MCW8313207.1 hypothetical protein [Sphingobacterium sp. InxBP1]
MKISKHRLVIMLGGIALLLCIPLIAMQFTEEVKWTGRDFVVMGALLTLTALLWELVWRGVRTFGYRVLLCSFIVVGFLLIWAELAVGIFGTPIAGS